MKLAIKSAFIFALVASLAIASDSLAQACNERNIRKNIKAGLEAYIFETASSKPYNMFNEPRTQIDAAFSAFAQENYRVLNLCEGFSGAVEFSVIDANKNVIFNNKGDKNTNKFDFTAERSGDYIIRFTISEKSNPNACVAYAIGYK